MAKLPPQPLGVAPGSSYWNDWYEKLRTFVEMITTSVDWSIITGKPTTLAGYGITNGQPLDDNLTALAAVGSTGLYTVTGAGTSTTRTLTGSGVATVTNGSGVGGNPVVDVPLNITPTWTALHTFNAGVGFPAAAVASANPNVLDDYEEGTFVPTISGSTTAGVGTYSVQVGAYTKIGNLVTFSLNINITNHTGTGDLLITDLPFTSTAVANTRFPITLHATSLTFTGQLVGLILASSNSIRLDTFTSGAAATQVPMDVSFGICAQGSYHI
jgi:hypothetical protein